MDATLSLISPAKLNLFLHINGIRNEAQTHSGYHELQTLFQILDRGDKMQFTSLTHSPDIELSSNLDGIKKEDNLIYRAAKLLQKKSGTHLGGKICIQKNLPLGGGLGGGSSNAATTLLAFNYLWSLNYSQDELSNLGAYLGADIPVFVKGYSAIGEGIGDELSSVKLEESWYLILTPNCHVNTTEIFSHEGLTRDTPKQRIAPALEGGNSKHFLNNCVKNDCETLVTSLYPEIDEAIKWLNQFGQGRLTGTGACCFSRFDSEAEAQQVLNEAQFKFKGFIAKGVNLSPAIKKLNEAKGFATDQ